MGTSASSPENTGEQKDPVFTEHFGVDSSTKDLWLVAARTFVDFHEILPYATLSARGRLVKWTQDSKRTVVMISHQWASSSHPDPKMRQTAVLQQLFCHMSNGKVSAGHEELEPVLPSTAQQRQCISWDLWYDYCCLPQGQVQQGANPALMRTLFHAVDMVLVLAPPMLHIDGSIMNIHTHGTRGWCLLETMVAGILDKPLLAVTGQKSVFSLSAKGWMSTLPHKGKFSIHAHQDLVKHLTAQLLEWKCESCLEKKQEEYWRLYTAISQRLSPMESGRTLQPFWDRYRMDAAEALGGAKTSGFSPLMLACIEGNYSKVQSLLEAKADVNELRQTVLGRSTALAMAMMSSVAVVRSLMDANASCEVGNPMNYAVQFMNLETLNLLPASECHRANEEGDAPMNLAVLSQNPSMVDILLQFGAHPGREAGSSTKFAAHFTPKGASRKSKTADSGARLRTSATNKGQNYVSDDSSSRGRRNSANSRTSRNSRISGSAGPDSDATGSHDFNRWFGRPPSPREVISDAETVADVKEQSPISGVRFDEELQLQAKPEPQEKPASTIVVTLTTPIQIASYFGNLEMVQLLFHRGADPEEASHGYSAMQVAQACGHHHIVRFLTMAMPLSYVTI